MTAKELERLRSSAQRGQPYGNKSWQRRSRNAWDWSPLFTHADDRRRAKPENWTYNIPFSYVSAEEITTTPITDRTRMRRILREFFALKSVRKVYKKIPLAKGSLGICEGRKFSLRCMKRLQSAGNRDGRLFFQTRRRLKSASVSPDGVAPCR